MPSTSGWWSNTYDIYFLRFLSTVTYVNERRHFLEGAPQYSREIELGHTGHENKLVTEHKQA